MSSSADSHSKGLKSGQQRIKALVYLKMGASGHDYRALSGVSIALSPQCRAPDLPAAPGLYPTIRPENLPQVRNALVTSQCLPY